MEEVVLDQIYLLLKTQGYKFQECPGKSVAKFSSYKDAFAAAFSIKNSFIKASADNTTHGSILANKSK